MVCINGRLIDIAICVAVVMSVLVTAAYADCSNPMGGATDISDELNARIAASDPSVCNDQLYCGGYNSGVLFRAPDFFDDASGTPRTQVVPASLIHNDIYAPTVSYPAISDPWCGNNGSDGFFDTGGKQGNCVNDYRAWTAPTLGAVVGYEGLSNLYQDWDNVQSDDWGYGVFYATDSNSGDKRCQYLSDDNPLGEAVYDCPDGTAIKLSDGSVVDGGPLKQWKIDNSLVDAAFAGSGSGHYYAGNPEAYDNAGGGAGCHWDANFGIDQQNAYFDYSGACTDVQNLVQDFDCQCNYNLKGTDFNNDGSWNDWVSQWMGSPDVDHQCSDPGGESYYKSIGRDWLSVDPGRDPITQFIQAPSWAVDTAACWVNNPRDMINLQNAIYMQSRVWNNQMVPAVDWEGDFDSPFAQGIYWGWNEIPVPQEIDDPSSQYVTSFAVSIPPGLCYENNINDDLGGFSDSICCVDDEGQYLLECQILAQECVNTLVSGVENVGNRPGSYILFMKHELRDDDFGGAYPGYYETYFYCESWSSPNGFYEIVYAEQDASNPTGACYVAKGPNHYDPCQAQQDQGCP